MDKLFVYGTLKPGFSNNFILTDIGGHFFKATLWGFQFDKKWEKETGYPGLIKTKSTDKVEGFVFVSKNLSKYWDALDIFETKAYQRIETPIELEDNSKTIAFVYIINSEFDLSNF
jgi:gamma-glutamylcyclotransferase (GGCT)/AIG2-like uncharacterized protein YtfP